MVDNISEQTTGSDNEQVGNESTATPKEPEKKSFSQDELDKLFADRQKRGEDAAAKRLEKQYKAQIDELNAKLKAFQEKDLSDVERIKLEHESATAKVSELTNELTGTRQENAKLRALIKAGVQPDQLDGLLKRVSGSTEEEIFADVEELKGLGWIGAKPTQQTTEEKPKGLGTQTKTGEPAQKKSLYDQLAEVNRKLRDPKLPYAEKSALIDLSLQLNRKIQKGET